MMKAMVCTKYGSPDVLQLQEVEKPVPTSNEVLIKVHATTATTASVIGRTGKPYLFGCSSALQNLGNRFWDKSSPARLTRLEVT